MIASVRVITVLLRQNFEMFLVHTANTSFFYKVIEFFELRTGFLRFRHLFLIVDQRNTTKHLIESFEILFSVNFFFVSYSFIHVS